MRVLSCGLSAELERQLESKGIMVIPTKDGDDLLSALKHSFAREVLPDALMLHLDSVAVVPSYAARVRRAGYSMPVLLLGGEGDRLPQPSWIKIQVWESGGDDFFPAPQDLDEVAACVCARIRLNRAIDNLTVQIGPIEVDLGAHEVRCGGTRAQLSETEYRMLELLALRKAKRRGASKEEIGNFLDTKNQFGSNFVDVYIFKLRRKLDDLVPGAGQHIRTIFGHGYKLSDERVCYAQAQKGAS